LRIAIPAVAIFLEHYVFGNYLATFDSPHSADFYVSRESESRFHR